MTALLLDNAIWRLLLAVNGSISAGPLPTTINQFPSGSSVAVANRHCDKTSHGLKFAKIAKMSQGSIAGNTLF